MPSKRGASYLVVWDLKSFEENGIEISKAFLETVEDLLRKNQDVLGKGINDVTFQYEDDTTKMTGGRVFIRKEAEKTIITYIPKDTD